MAYPTRKSILSTTTMTPETSMITDGVYDASMFNATTTRSVWAPAPSTTTPAPTYIYNAAATDPASDDDPSISASEVAVLVGGGLVIIHQLDTFFRSVYRNACYHSDRRLLGLGDREQNWKWSTWSWVASTLERAWIPLWFGHEQIRDAAVRQAIDDEYLAQHIRRCNEINEAIAQEDRDDIQDWIVEVRRQRHERLRQRQELDGNEFDRESNQDRVRPHLAREVPVVVHSERYLRNRPTCRIFKFKYYGAQKG